VDEHIHPNVTAAFRLTLKTVEAARLWRLRGRDERDYLRELYSKNIVFATSDREFVNEIIQSNTRHAGLVYVPNKSSDYSLEVWAEVAGIFIRGGTHRSPYAFRNCILYPDNGGLNLIQGAEDHELVFSWEWLFADRESNAA
jgi:hypothetical protein